MDVDDVDEILDSADSTESITEIFINTINMKLGEDLTASYEFSNNINILRLPEDLLIKFQQGLDHFLLTKDCSRLIDDWKDDYEVTVKGAFLSNEISRSFCINIWYKMPMMLVEDEEQPTNVFYDFVKIFVDKIYFFSYKYMTMLRGDVLTCLQNTSWWTHFFLTNVMFDESLTRENGNWLEVVNPFFVTFLSQKDLNFTAFMQEHINLLPSSDVLETMNDLHEHQEEELANEEEKILELEKDFKATWAEPKIKFVLKLEAELRRKRETQQLQSNPSIFVDENALSNLVENSFNRLYLKHLYTLKKQNTEIGSLKEEIAQMKSAISKSQEISSAQREYELIVQQIKLKEEDVAKSREMLLNALASYEINDSSIRGTNFIIFVEKNINFPDRIPAVKKEIRILNNGIKIREKEIVRFERFKDNALRSMCDVDKKIKSIEKFAFSRAEHDADIEDKKERLRTLEIHYLELMMEEEVMLKKKLVLYDTILSKQMSSIHCEDYDMAENFKTILGEDRLLACQYHGILVENIEINEEYRFALTAALNNNLYIHIVNTRHVLHILRRKISEDTWLNTNFIVLDKIDKRKCMEIVGAESLSKVSISGGTPQGRKVVNSLLLDSYLCENLEKAIEVSTRMPLIKCFLTTGEMIIKGVVVSSPLLENEVPFFNDNMKMRKLTMWNEIKECCIEINQLKESIEESLNERRIEFNNIIDNKLINLFENVEKINDWNDESNKIYNQAEIAGIRKAREIIFKYYRYMKNPTQQVFIFDKIESYLQKVQGLEEAIDIAKADYQKKLAELSIAVLDKLKYVSLLLKDKHYPDIERNLKEKMYKLATLEKAQEDRRLMLNELKTLIQDTKNILMTDIDREIYFKENNLEILKQSISSDLNNDLPYDLSIQELKQKQDELSESRERVKMKSGLLLNAPMPPKGFPSSESAQEKFAPFFKIAKGKADGVNLWSGEENEIINTLINQFNTLFVKFYPNHLICNNKISHPSGSELPDSNELCVITENEVLKVEQMNELLKYALYLSIFFGCRPRGGPLIVPLTAPFNDDIVDVLQDPFNLPTRHNQVLYILPN